MTKNCFRCKQDLPIVEFTIDRHDPSGTFYICRQCLKDYDFERTSRQRLDMPPTRVCNRCKTEQTNESFPANRRGYGGYSGICKSCHTIASAERRWGISDILAKVDAGYCEICNDKLQRGKYAVDHDHSCCPSRIKSCGKCVRGLICEGCNTGMGSFQESPERMLAAIEYLKRWSND